MELLHRRVCILLLGIKRVIDYLRVNKNNPNQNIINTKNLLFTR